MFWILGSVFSLRDTEGIKLKEVPGYESFCYGINEFGKRNPRFTKSSRVCCSLDPPMNDQYFMLGIGEPLRV